MQTHVSKYIRLNKSYIDTHMQMHIEHTNVAFSTKQGNILEYRAFVHNASVFHVLSFFLILQKVSFFFVPNS